jgi:branched-subunit amino acid transport protein AzlD
MSLKSFHILFIVLSISLLLLFGFWASVLEYSEPNQQVSYYLGLLSLGVAAVLTTYLFSFIRKYKKQAVAE